MTRDALQESSVGGDGSADDLAETARLPRGVQPFEYWATPIESGRTLVEASAGTGKTFALAGLVLRLVLEGDRLARTPGGMPDLRRLLVVTFTVAATEELKTRIRAALRTALAVARGEAEPDGLTARLATLLARPDAEDRLLAALDGVDEAGIFTIHGFCQRVLNQAAFESGTPFDLELAEEMGALESRAANDAWAALAHGQPWLAALAVRNRWTPGLLASHHKRATTYPDTDIVPTAPPLDQAVADIRQRAAEVAALWDAHGISDLLDGLAWTAKAPFEPDRLADVVRRVATVGDDPDAVEAALWFTPDALATALHGNRTVNKERAPQIEAHPVFSACAELEAAVQTLRLSLIHAFSGAVGSALAAIKERRGVLSFDDLLSRLHDALLAPETGSLLAAGIRRQFGVALVDEFQDTDPVQYAIFKTAFEGAPLVFVGDPKQAIYAFRGADIHAYLRAQREAHGRYTLGTNWRSARPLVRAVNALFAQPLRPFVYDEIGFLEVEAQREAPRLAADARRPLVWWTVETDGKPMSKGDARPQCVEATVGEIVRLLDGGGTVEGRPLEPGDLAVLVRKNEQAREVQAALREAGVPAVVSRAGDIRQTAEIADLEIVLHALAHPDDGGALRAALTTELFGWSAARIAGLGAEDGALDRVRRSFRDGQKTWRRHGVLRALVEIAEAEGVTARLLAHPDGERRMTNLRHAVELLHEIEGAGRSPEDLLHWLRHREEQTLSSREKSELRLESDARAVQVTTLHNAKGLEYEVVFLPFLWDVVEEKDWDQMPPVYLDPLVHVGERVVYDLGSEDHAEHRRQREVERLAEFLRLAYVGLTRAKERAYVVWGAINEAHNSALGYLLAGHGAEGETDADHVARARARAREANPAAALDALVSAHADVMEALDLPAGAPPARSASGDGDAEGALAARALDDASRQRVGDAWRRASFSAWSRGSGHDGLSHDGLAASDESDDEVPAAQAVPVGLHAFAAGPGPGTCLHAVLQHADWRCPEESDAAEAVAQHNRETVERWLQTHGLGTSGRPHRAPLAPADEVIALLDRVAQAPLFADSEGAPLRLVDAEARLAEWPFAFPLARVAPRDLADAFRQHGAEPFGADYADALATLSRDAVDGLMTGEIDLVALAGDRWWIVDWKSNRLGGDASAYTPDALATTMAGHHYGLQLHLYTVGLHRFLRSRLGGAYDYDTYVGGATYTFLRGMEGGGEAGLFRHRPSATLVAALDRLLTPSRDADA